MSQEKMFLKLASSLLPAESFKYKIRTNAQHQKYIFAVAKRGTLKRRGANLYNLLKGEGNNLAPELALAEQSRAPKDRRQFYGTIECLFRNGIVPQQTLLPIIQDDLPHFAQILLADMARETIDDVRDAMASLLLYRMRMQAPQGQTYTFTVRAYNALCKLMEQTEPGIYSEHRLCYFGLRLMRLDSKFHHGTLHDAVTSRLTFYVEAINNPLLEEVRADSIYSAAECLATAAHKCPQFITPAYIALQAAMLDIEDKKLPRHITNALIRHTPLSPTDEKRRNETAKFNRLLHGIRATAAVELSDCVLSLTNAGDTPTIRGLFSEKSWEKIAHTHNQRQLPFEAAAKLSSMINLLAKLHDSAERKSQHEQEVQAANNAKGAIRPKTIDCKWQAGYYRPI